MTGDGSEDKPNTARVYDYWLGGHLNFEADRQLAAAIEAINPQARVMARRNRAFVGRAVTWAARQGITQFLDLGAGLPTSPAVHESARAVNPGAKVVYVDDDPVVLIHAAAALRNVDGTALIGGNVSDPAKILGEQGLREVIDLSEPVCVILASVLHFFGERPARDILAGFTGPLVRGSCAAVSVAYAEPGLHEKTAAAYSGVARSWNHDRGTVVAWFAAAGLELIEPGLTTARTWRPGWPDPGLTADPARMHAGVGVKP